MEATQAVTQNKAHSLLYREALEIVGSLGRFRGILVVALGLTTLAMTLASVLSPHPEFSPAKAMAFGAGLFSIGLLLISKL